IDRRDLILLQAIAMVTVMIFAVANLVADLLYAFLDPRIRLGQETEY
ncbi:MAG: ABC transporter permease, partial [Chloroflexi bacterium]